MNGHDGIDWRAAAFAVISALVAAAVAVVSIVAGRILTYIKQ